MPIKFYAAAFSPPCRSVWMCMDILGVEYEWVETHPGQGDTMTPEFLKLNPQHTVPTMVDDDLIITESRAMLMHLARKYGGEESKLYPKDLRTRSMVDQRLNFDQGHCWQVIRMILFPVMGKNTMYDPAAQDTLNEVFGWCQDFVKATGFIAGTDHITIADLAILAAYTSLRECGLMPVQDLPQLEAWAERCQKLIKNYDTNNAEGAKTLGTYFKTTLEKIKNDEV